jgi:hypothetical protein
MLCYIWKFVNGVIIKETKNSYSADIYLGTEVYTSVTSKSPVNKLLTPALEEVSAASAILVRSLCIVHPGSPNTPTLNNRH